jgi:hypothetical protein
MGKVDDVLEQLGNDLVTRQINLIIAPGGMSAEPVPDDPTVTLREVYRWYFNKLSREDEADKMKMGDEISAYTPAQLKSGFESLAHALEPYTKRTDVYEAESIPAATPPEELPAAERIVEAIAGVTDRMEYRMQSTSIALAKIAGKRANAEDLDARDLAILRKAWEIGVDEVIMQTTIALDGDVVTRVDSRFCDDASKPLYGLHDEGVSAAMRTWKDVVGAAIDLMRKLFGSL